MKHQVYLLDNTSETDYSNIDADNIVLLVDNSISISDDTQVSLDGKVDKVSGSSLIADTSITRLANTSGENTGDQDLSGKLDKNTTITPSTKTKITYDADGLVTEGDDATTEDINDSTDRRYLTDTQKTEATRNATTSQNGLISSTDWNTFNDKQGAGNYEPAFTKNTAFNKDFGTTAGTIPQGNEVLRTSDALTEVTDTNKLITVEDYGGLIYISQWNPTTNTPTLADADATKFREAYISLNDFTRFGIDWEKGDYLVYDINGDIFREENPLKNIVSTVGFSNNYDDLDNFPTFKTVENLSILGTGNIDLTKTMVGLGNVDNTSDLNKPVSTDTQTALNLKANKASPTFTGDVTSGGNIEAPAIKLTSGAADGYFLKTDADGNATWTPISASQVYKGTWNADTNTPTLADNTGVQGNFYRVTTPGTSDLGSGNKTFEINDDVSHNGTIWERIPAVGYTLQTATSTVLGGVKIGNGVSISNSVISVSTDYEPTKGLDDNYVTDAEAVVIGNTSGTNTGDEDTSSIQNKRPLKTIESLSLEGNGDIDLTKAMVALGSADNTSDADKPISSATQTALNNKVDKVTGSSLIQDTSITRLADTSGTNTGDNATNSQYSGLVSDTGTPAILSNGSTPTLNSGITASEIRTLIGAGTSSTDTDTQLSTEQVQDIMGSTWIDGKNTIVVYDDVNGTLKIDAIDQRSDEEIRDVSSAQWIDGTNTTVVKDDAGNTIKINSVDTNTQYSTGSGLISSGTIFSHADTSSQASSTNSGRTYIQDIVLDTYGHITGIDTATETVDFSSVIPIFSTVLPNPIGQVYRSPVDTSVRELGNIIKSSIDSFYYHTTTFVDSGGTQSIRLLKSSDLVTWTDEGIIVADSEDPYLVESGGEYFLYVEDKEPTTFRNIKLYKSDDLSTWTDEGVVLDYNDDTWESQDVSSPTVIIEEGTWYMYYEGRSGTQDGAIGLATSSNGIDWTKSNRNPIFTGTNLNSDLQWADHLVPDDIIKSEGLFYMTAHAKVTEDNEWFCAVLVSNDLENWVDMLGTWSNKVNYTDESGYGLMIFKSSEYGLLASFINEGDGEDQRSIIMGSFGVSPNYDLKEKVIKAKRVEATTFIGNGSQITNVDAATLDSLDSNDFVRSTGNTSQNVNGNKTFLNKALLPNQSGTKGAGIGSNSSSFYSFYQSNGTTRKGYIGFPITTNSDLSIENDASNKSLTLRQNGNLDYNGDVIADNFFEGSDKRLKTNIKKISKSVYSYELKTQPGITVYGTIAQEIEKTNPEVVKKPDDGGMMSVNYNSFLSLKLAEQENKTDDLQKQIDELKELIKNK